MTNRCIWLWQKSNSLSGSQINWLNWKCSTRDDLFGSSSNFAFIRKDCFQNKSKFITEDHFTKHMNITIHQLKQNGIIYKSLPNSIWNYVQKIIKEPASLSVVRVRNVCAKRLVKLSLLINLNDVFCCLKYCSDTFDKLNVSEVISTNSLSDLF